VPRSNVWIKQFLALGKNLRRIYEAKPLMSLPGKTIQDKR
jgi:hypothetical protein